MDTCHSKVTILTIHLKPVGMSLKKLMKIIMWKSVFQLYMYFNLQYHLSRKDERKNVYLVICTKFSQPSNLILSHVWCLYGFLILALCVFMCESVCVCVYVCVTEFNKNRLQHASSFTNLM